MDHNRTGDARAPLMTAGEKQEIEEVFGRHINRGQVAYLKSGHLDVLEVEREGIHFTDPASGREMADCFTAAGCFSVGRHNPVVLAALDRAIAEYDMGSAGMVSAAKVELARKLCAIAPGDISRVLFSSGGGDAIDGALKLARGATGRADIIATVKAYHGHTGFALSANGKPHYREHFEPLMPGFTMVPFGDLDAMRAVVGDSTAAIIIEPVQGEAGIFLASADYLRGLRKLCDEVGALLIFDEVQTGFGRTGRMFASEHSGVVPDIMAVAKAIGGGIYPNAAILYRESALLTDFVSAHADFHPTSTGGSDIGCRVSLAVIDYIEAQGLCENAERQGDALRAALTALMTENPKIIKEVRGIGLMVGIEYIHEFLGPLMSDALAKRGVFAAYSGNAPQVMRFMLPLTVDDDELGQVIAAIRGAVADMKRILPVALIAAKIPPVLKLLNRADVQTRVFGALRQVEDFADRVRGSLRKR